MFKAIRTTDNAEIIILAPDWEEAVDTLRKLGRADLLVCQECRQAVRVKAGLIRRPYFAHKQRQDCTYQTESPALLQARATLYKWLVGKFGVEHVKIEQKIEGADLPRPVDCWVIGTGGPFAYWITDSGIKAQTREGIKLSFEQRKAKFQWLCTASMLNEVEQQEHRIILSKTERDMMTSSRYDDIYATSSWHNHGRTLYYLNGETTELTTFRNLQLVHAPHTFEANRLVTPLSDVLISPKTGEFVHRGEHELWDEYRAYQTSKEPPETPRPLPVPTIRSMRAQVPLSSILRHQRPQIEIKETPPNPQEGTCIFCGQVTTDWWLFDGATKQCRCRACRSAGREQ